MKGNPGPLFSHWHRQKANTSATIMSHRPPVFLQPPLGPQGDRAGLSFAVLSTSPCPAFNAPHSVAGP